MEHLKKRTVSNILINVVLTLLALTFILPLIYIISGSLTSLDDLAVYGYRLIPPKIDLTSYKLIFMRPERILNAYAVSVSVTVIGTPKGVYDPATGRITFKVNRF